MYQIVHKSLKNINLIVSIRKQLKTVLVRSVYTYTGTLNKNKLIKYNKWLIIIMSKAKYNVIFTQVKLILFIHFFKFYF